jgi:tetratricopeptide (TPR) repeat protein
MRRTSARPYCYLPLLALSLALPALGSDPEWMEVRSPHFSVVTDAGEKRGRDAALHFEQMRAVFGTIMVKAKVTMPTPLQIVAFRNTKEMRQFAPLFKGKPTPVSGLFEGNSDRSFILLDMSAEDPWQVVFHEYAHQLLNGNTNLSVQPWFDEGFAEYFSTIKVNGREADVGLPSETNYQVLQQTGLVKVADLFRVQHDSSTYNESGDHRSVFYAESWLVVHYLYEKNLIAKVGPYFDLAIDRRVPAEDAIQQAFGFSAAQFDKELRDYFSRNRFLYGKIPAPAGIESAGYTAKPMTMADAKAVLADTHLHSPDYQDKAVAEFQEVLKLQADNAAALRGLGYAYLMKRDFHRAGEYFAQAADHDSNDPRVLYYSGMLAEMEEGQGLASDSARLAVIQKQLEKSVALDPEFADAYSMLAFAYMSQGNHEQALTTMKKAVALNPRNQDYLFNLTQLYLANREVDPALAILEQLKNSTDPAVAAKASQSLAQAKEFKQAMQASAYYANLHTQLAGEGIAAGEHPATIEPEPISPKELSPVRFLKGKVTIVDCSRPPTAVLTVVSGAKIWKLQVKDSGHVVVIGADNLSSAWKNQSVAVNFRATGEANGDVVSVEVQ